MPLSLSWWHRSVSTCEELEPCYGMTLLPSIRTMTTLQTSGKPVLACPIIKERADDREPAMRVFARPWPPDHHHRPCPFQFAATPPFCSSCCKLYLLVSVLQRNLHGQCCSFPPLAEGGSFFVGKSAAMGDLCNFSLQRTYRLSYYLRILQLVL